jgi:hypothetical protein
MALYCWGFQENVSRETFLSSGERNTNIAITVCVAFSGCQGVAQPNAIDALPIETAKQVWLVIKTYSCNLVEPSRR